ncbi:MAG: hypothetical protein EXS36_08670 [Pedosphaera sp.]|nr:hypothetical protein [Pedosphaera sp.]
MRPRHIELLIKIALAVAPLIVLAAIYLLTDPFKVLHRYRSYYESEKPCVISLNRDFVSVQTLLQNRQLYPYDSFILGNSRSLFYEVADWQQSTRSTHSFHLDAYGESLVGIHAKIRLLDRLGIPLRNVLLILDYETLKTAETRRGHIFTKHPALTGQSRFGFQLEFFKSFYNPLFLKSYLPYLLLRQIKPYMLQDFMLDDRPMRYDLRSNEIQFLEMETRIAHDPDSFYGPRTHLFYTRPSRTQMSPSVILARQKALLKEIREILESRRTEYRLIINPLYDQQKFNAADLAILVQIFGPDQVFDYSGINDITADPRNYYETYHYRPHIARRILKEIYSQPRNPPRNPQEPNRL